MTLVLGLAKFIHNTAMKSVLHVFLTFFFTVIIFVAATFIYRFFYLGTIEIPEVTVDESAAFTGALNEDAYQSYDDNAVDIEEDDFTVNEEALTDPDFVRNKFIPASATDVEVLALDFEDDGVKEYAIKYTQDEVKRENGGALTVAYIQVYQWSDELNQWKKIKQDGVVIVDSRDSNFVNFEVVEIATPDIVREALLVSKRWQTGALKGYYIFGEQKNGEIDDWPIPKGYLHQDEYLQDGENGVALLSVAVQEGGVLEEYTVACEPSSPELIIDWCRSFQLLIPFDYEAFEFGTPEIRNNN